MRKSFFILAFLALTLPGMAQTGFHAGLVTAYQNTWVINDEQYDNVSYEYQTTFRTAPIGFSAGYKFNPYHGIMAEVIYSRQGGKYDLIDQNDQKAGEKHINLNYIAVPLFFKFTTTGRLRFNFQVGPQASFLLSGEEVNKIDRSATFSRHRRSDITLERGNYLLTSTDEDTPAAVSEFDNFDFGIAGGLGVEYSFTPQWYISANFRGNYNFRNIFKDEYIEHPLDVDTYTLRYNVVGGIQVGVHYFFRKQELE